MIDFDKYYEHLRRYMGEGLRLWQVTIVATDGSTPSRPGMKMLIPESGEEYGNLGGGEMEHSIIEYVREHQPGTTQVLAFKLNNKGQFTEIEIDVNVDISTNMICGGSVEVFIEPLFRKDKLYIIGAGHCGKALSQIAKLCGFYVVMIDNRDSVLSKEAGLYADRVFLSNYSDFDEIIDFDESAYVVIMTHGHVHDRSVLEQCLRRPAKYLGMIGSKGKVKETMDKLISKGFTAEELGKVHAPIGLPICSQTPYEIAVSICAQLIEIKNCKPAMVEVKCVSG